MLNDSPSAGGWDYDEHVDAEKELPQVERALAQARAADERNRAAALADRLAWLHRRRLRDVNHEMTRISRLADEARKRGSDTTAENFDARVALLRKEKRALKRKLYGSG